MIQYKVLKGTRRKLYLKGLKANYFYIFCFLGAFGAIFIVVSGINSNIVLHIFLAVLYIILLYGIFFFLSIEKPYKNVKKKYQVIQNIDLIKILRK